MCHPHPIAAIPEAYVLSDKDPTISPFNFQVKISPFRSRVIIFQAFELYSRFPEVKTVFPAKMVHDPLANSEKQYPAGSSPLFGFQGPILPHIRV
jgi:hypothetical protein